MGASLKGLAYSLLESVRCTPIYAQRNTFGNLFIFPKAKIIARSMSKTER